MKKLRTKILSVLLVIMILLNSIMPIVNAARSYNEDYTFNDKSVLVPIERVDKTGAWAILELRPTKTSYAVGDEIGIEVIMKEASFSKISEFIAYFNYDDEYLELQVNSETGIGYEITKSAYSVAGFGKNQIYINAPYGATNVTGVGEVIVTIKFKALKDSSETTEFWLENIDISGQNGDEEKALSILEQCNDPILTLGGSAPEVTKATHGIEITKVDKYLYTITKDEAIFKLITPNETTGILKEGINGITTFEDLEMPTGSATNTYTYTIHESKAPDGYVENETDTQITIIFDDDGNITSAKNGTSDLTVENNIIKLQIVNEEEEVQVPTSKFTINLNKTDGTDTITSSEAMFKITPYGKDSVHKETTNGKFSYEIEVPEVVDTSTTYVYKLQEVKAPEGYALNSDEIDLGVRFSKNTDGTYSIFSATKSSGNHASITNTESEINVTVVNEIQEPEEQFLIVITKKDEDGTTIRNNPAKFIATAPNGTATIASTDVNGTFTIKGIMPEGDLNPNGYEYKLQEIDPPTGYKLNSDEISVVVKFIDVDGKRNLDSATVTGSNVTQEAIVDNVLPLTITNKKEPLQFTIKINKVDESGNLIKKAGTLFEISNPITGESEYVQTDANGLAIYKAIAPETAGTQNFTIKERVAPDGYVLDETEYTLPLVFTKTTSGIALTSHNISSSKIAVDGSISSNIITLKFENEKEVDVVQPTTFDIIVNKIDFETGNPIPEAGIIFKAIENGTTNYVMKETDSTGKAVITLPMPSTPGNVTYVLTEEKAPTNYDRTTEQMQITAIFTQDASSIINLDDITVATSQYIQKTGTVSNNEAQVNVKNKKTVVPVEVNYQLVIQKVDSADNSAILEEDVFFKVTDPSGVSTYLPTDANGRITIDYNMPTAADTHTFTIEEVKAPTNYELYSTPQTVNVTFADNSGTIVISGATSSGSKINTPTVSGNKVTVEILNDKTQVPVVNNYTLKINKYGTDINANISEKDVLFSLTDESGKVEYLATDSTGLATFIGIIPDEAKTVNYVLKELSGPTGYVKNETNMNISLVFTDDSGTIKLSDIIVNTSQGIQKVGSVRNDIAEIRVLNEPKTADPTFNLKINKYGTDINANISQENVVFEVIDSNGETNFVLTNGAGVAVYTGKMPETAGTLRYTLKEISGPTGYVKNPNTMDLDLVFVDNSGTIELNDITVNTAQEIEKVGVVSNVAEVKVLNNPVIAESEETFTLKVNKVDSETKVNIPQKDIVFKVTNQNGEEQSILTNNGGVAVYTGKMPETEGTLNYTLQEISGPTGYIKNPNTMNLALIFTTNDEGKIILSDITVNEDDGIEKVGVAANIAEVKVLNEKEVVEIEEKFTVTINKKDKESGDTILQSDVVFKVVDEDGKEEFIATNSLGIAVFSGVVPKVATTKTYRVTEISAPSGYIKMENDITIECVFTQNGGKIVLSAINLSSSEDIEEVGIVSNNAEVNIYNDKEEVVVPDEKFTLTINKIDSETKLNIPQKDVIFKITDDKGQATYIATNELGEAVYTGIIPKTAGDVNYTIVETVGPTGYIKNPNVMNIILKFVDNSGTIELNDIEVNALQGIEKVGTVTNNSAEVNVLNETIKDEPEPVKETFVLELNKVNSQTLENILQKDVIIKVKTEDGVSNYLGTDENGKISITYSMPETEGTVRYEIEEIKAPNGYILYSNIQYIDLTFGEVDGKIQITNVAVTGDKIQEVSFGTNKATIKVLNDKEPIVEPEPETQYFDLKINKVDSKTLENIQQKEVLFSLTNEDGEVSYLVTDTSGVVKFIGIIPDTAKTVNYVLKEIFAPTGYIKNENNMNISLVFIEEAGAIKLNDIIVNTAQGVQKVGTVNDNVAEIKVLNELKTADPVFNLKINKFGTDINSNILQEDVVFEVTDSNGEVSYVLTNGAGVAVYTGKVPETAGTIRYKLKEISGPSGYVKNPNTMDVDLVFVDNSGTIVLNDIIVNTDQGIEKIGITANVAEVKVLNNPIVVETEETFNLKINKVDAETKENILQKDVVFKVINQNGEVQSILTNNGGVAVYTGNMPETAGTLNYTLQEISGPIGYIKNPNIMNLALVFTSNEEGKIILSDIIVNEEQGIEKVGVAANVAELKVLNEREEEVIEERFTVSINKQDAESKDIILQSDVIFKVVDSEGKEEYIATNSLGVAVFSGIIPEEATTKTYRILEISAPSGYIKIDSEITIECVFTQSDNKIVLSEINVSPTEYIEKVGITSNNAEVNIFNEKEVEEPPVEENDPFVIIINKIDSETKLNILQKDVIFKITDDKGNVSYVGTNELGEAVFTGVIPKTAGDFNYTLIETIGPAGYIKNSNIMDLKLTFVNNSGKIKLSNITVQEEQGIEKVGTVENNTAEVNVLNQPVKDEPIPEKESFILELNKVDSDKLENILQKNVVIKVKTADGIIGFFETDENGRISITYNMPETEGTVRYEVEEIKAPSGYRLHSDIQYINLTFTKVEGKMTITNVTVSGEKIKVEGFEANKAIVKILNEKELIIEPEPETKYFDLKINKVDSITLENILQKGVLFKVTDKDGGYTFYETNEKGVTTATLPMPKKAGTYRYEILENVAPTGYNKNENVLTVDITFAEIDGVMKITEIVVNEASGIRKVRVDENVAEVKVLNEKVKEEPTDPGDTQEPEDKKEFKLDVKKYLTKVTEKYSNTGMQKVTNIAKSNKIVKLDIKSSEFKYLTAELEYTIVVKNTGNIAGTVNSIIDQMPSQLIFNAGQNAGWLKQNGKAIYNLKDVVLQPGESKEVTIKLQYNGKQDAGTITNIATVDATNNIVDKENPTSGTATIVIGVKTGEELIIYSTLAVTSLLIFGLGVLGIKKYVI